MRITVGPGIIDHYTISVQGLTVAHQIEDLDPIEVEELTLAQAELRLHLAVLRAKRGETGEVP